MTKYLIVDVAIPWTFSGSVVNLTAQSPLKSIPVLSDCMELSSDQHKLRLTSFPEYSWLWISCYGALEEVLES